MRWIMVLTAAGFLGAPAIAQRITGSIIAPQARTTVPSINGDLGQINDSIRDGRRSDQLTKRDARRLRRESDQIGTLEDRYAAGGLSASEQAELRTRAEVLRAQTNAQRMK